MEIAVDKGQNIISYHEIVRVKHSYGLYYYE